METLNKDIKRKFALELRPPDLIKFCLVKREINKEICESDEFWRLKLERDYPHIFYYYQRNDTVVKHPKDVYVKQFLAVSKVIEGFINELRKYNFLTRTYISVSSEEKRNFYNDIYDMYENHIKTPEIAWKSKHNIDKDTLRKIFNRLRELDKLYN